MAQQNDVIIRWARAEDVPIVLEKIHATCILQKVPYPVTTTVDRLLKDGGFKNSNDPKRFNLFVAETEIDGKKTISWFCDVEL